MSKLKNWRLKAKEERRFKSGHPWVYSNELQDSPKGIEPGEFLALHDAGGVFLAYGFGNPNSLIAFRALSRKKSEHEILPDDFFKRLIAEAMFKAIQFRLHWYKPTQSFRMIYGEVDSLPGLVVDRFANSKQVTYIVQPHSAGMDRHLELVTAGLKTVSEFLKDPKETTVIYRRDAGSREREGLGKEATEVKILATGEAVSSQDPFLNYEFSVPGIKDTEISMKTDLVGGQKTGFFFDQLQNIRLTETFLLQKLRLGDPKRGEGKPFRVLDLCSYIGQWSAHLTQALIAREALPVEITCVDSSAAALELVDENIKNLAKTNGKSDQIKMQRVRTDVLEPMPMLPSRSYDVVIADPPALIKSRKSFPQGKHAYVNLFTSAIDRTAPSGLVVCCSCSQLLSNEDLLDCLEKATRRSGRTVRWLAQGSPAIDHFSLFEFREGQYLKCWIGQVE